MSTKHFTRRSLLSLTLALTMLFSCIGTTGWSEEQATTTEGLTGAAPVEPAPATELQPPDLPAPQPIDYYDEEGNLIIGADTEKQIVIEGDHIEQRWTDEKGKNQVVDIDPKVNPGYSIDENGCITINTPIDVEIFDGTGDQTPALAVIQTPFDRDTNQTDTTVVVKKDVDKLASTTGKDVTSIALEANSMLPGSAVSAEVEGDVTAASYLDEDYLDDTTTGLSSTSIAVAAYNMVGVTQGSKNPKGSEVSVTVNGDAEAYAENIDVTPGTRNSAVAIAVNNYANGTDAQSSVTVTGDAIATAYVSSEDGTAEAIAARSLAVGSGSSAETNINGESKGAVVASAAEGGTATVTSGDVTVDMKRNNTGMTFISEKGDDEEIYHSGVFAYTGEEKESGLKTNANVGVLGSVTVTSDHNSVGAYALADGNNNNSTIVITESLNVNTKSDDEGPTTIGMKLDANDNGKASAMIGGSIKSSSVSGTEEICEARNIGLEVKASNGGHIDASVAGDIVAETTISEKGIADPVTFGINAISDGKGSDIKITVNGKVEADSNVSASGDNYRKEYAITASAEDGGKIDMTVGKGVTGAVAAHTESDGKVILTIQNGGVTAEDARVSTQDPGILNYAVLVNNVGGTVNLDITGDVSSSVTTEEGGWTNGLCLENSSEDGIIDAKVVGNVTAEGGDNNAAINVQSSGGTTSVNVQSAKKITSEYTEEAPFTPVEVSGDDGIGLLINVIENSSSESASDPQVDIVVDGTVSGGEAAIVLQGTAEIGNNVNMTVWEIQPNENNVFVATQEEDGAKLSAASEKQMKEIQYIIKLEQPTAGATLSMSGTTLSEDGYQVAKEDTEVYMMVNLEEGYQLTGAYSDLGQSVEMLLGSDGNYYVKVPRGGGVYLSVKVEKIPESADNNGNDGSNNGGNDGNNNNNNNNNNKNNNNNSSSNNNKNNSNSSTNPVNNSGTSGSAVIPGSEIDTDNNGVPNHDDDDIDGNGVPNRLDNDMDGDGIPDDLDDDKDGNGIPDSEENWLGRAYGYSEEEDPDSLKVVFHPNGGALKDKTGPYTVYVLEGHWVDFPKLEEYEGYELKGWYAGQFSPDDPEWTEPDENAELYSETDVVKVTEDVVFTAIWKQK